MDSGTGSSGEPVSDVSRPLKGLSKLTLLTKRRNFQAEFIRDFNHGVL
jgi:hypothetical protein